MVFDLSQKKVVIIGGSSGMGLATAKAADLLGAEVILAGRSQDKLQAAAKELTHGAKTQSLDIAQPEQLQAFFEKIGHFDHLLTPGSVVHVGGFTQMPYQEEHASFDSKFWGQYYAAKYAVPYINLGGSITLFSGCWGHRPVRGSAIPASINGAIEALARALAVELAPLRVNAICPGIVDTPLFSAMPENERKAFFEQTAKSLPVGRVGTPEDVAQTAIYLMVNGYTTGNTVFVDGGDALR
ncbi:MAG TPA: SDR family oxidoreductase [Gammaproteobacteria bacterium]|nr:SDR family oxidoreductase [Gammaproteobacteria bacterium]